MKKILAITLASLSLSAYAQQKINVPGTKVMIVPPAHFEPATGFTGLQNDSAAIHVFDLDGGNFDANAATFGAKKFEEKGLKVIEFKETTINGYKAKYALVDAKSVTKNHMLIFGDSTFSVMLTGVVAGKDPKLSAAVKKSLFTATYQKSLKVDHLANAFFKVDESKSTFKFAHAAANLYAFTPGGSMDEDPDQSVILVSPMPAPPSATPESMGSAMIASIASKGVVVKETKNKWTGTVNGYDAYEVELYCESGDRKNVIYQFSVLHGDKAIVFTCMAFKDYEANIKEFKSLVKTVKFK